VGANAKEDIPIQTAYIFVPYTIVINVEKATKSELRSFFEQHPQVFQNNVDWEVYVLYAFFIFEKVKEDKSFWYPYLRIIPHCDMLMD